MSADPNYVQKFLRKPIFTFLSIEYQEDIKESFEYAIENYPPLLKKACNLPLKFSAGKVLRLVSSKAIQHELKERGVSRKNRRIAQYLTSGAFLVATYLPAKESGKVSKKIVGIIAKQIAVNETYHYVVDTLELDYPEFIKERPYLHKIAQIVCPLITKLGMHTILNRIISKVEDPAGMKNHYKNVYK